jgi:hypothetical protein
VNLSPPAAAYGMTSAPWDGGWFLADEANLLFHFV